MATVSKHNELNVITTRRTNRMSMPYEQYFGEMDISDEEKEKRIGLARKLEDLFLFIFLYLRTSPTPDKEYALDYVRTAYLVLASDYLGTSKVPVVIDEYVRDMTDLILASTFENMVIDDPEDYTLSQDRAQYIAENEACTIGNYGEYVDAIKQGMKFKTWHTIKDKSTRKTHYSADEQKVPILSNFKVGGYEMAYPRDASKGASDREIINCRCSVKYTKN